MLRDQDVGAEENVGFRENFEPLANQVTEIRLFRNAGPRIRFQKRVIAGQALEFPGKFAAPRFPVVVGLGAKGRFPVEFRESILQVRMRVGVGLVLVHCLALEWTAMMSASSLGRKSGSGLKPTNSGR